MSCRRCGNALAGTARFCGKCGTVVFSQEAETETAVMAPARMAAVLAPPAGGPPGGPAGMPPVTPAGMPPRVPQGIPPGMPPRMAAPQPPAGLPPGPAPVASYPQAPGGTPPGFGPRPNGAAAAKGNAGILIGLCALVVLAVAVTGYWAYTKIGGGGGGAGEATTPTRLYALMALDMTEERTRATGERDMLPVALVSDGLTELVPYSEGWAMPISWDMAMVIGSGTLPECMMLRRKGTETMWVHRDGRMIRSPEAIPTGCEGTLLPARAAKDNGLCGYADGATLRFRIQPQFQLCKGFEDGRAVVRKDGLVQFIDETGKTVIPPKFHSTGSFSEGVAAVVDQLSNKTGYIDRSGTFVIAAKYRNGFDFNEGLAAVTEGDSGKFGFIDRSGRMVIQPDYESVVFSFEAGRAVVRKGDRLSLIDKQGKELAGWASNRGIEALGEGMFAVKFQDEAQLVDRNGKPVSKGRYRQIGPFQFGYAVALGNQYSALLDRSGREVFQAGKALLGPYGGRYLTRLSPEGPKVDLIDISGNPRLRLQKGVLTRNPKP